MTEVRTGKAQRALELYNEIQLCREMGWTQDDLYRSTDEFVWAALNILDLEGKKQERENPSTRGGGGRPANPDAITHHQQHAPPTRVPD